MPGSDQKRGVRVTIEPAELTVDPGSEITTTVTVRNIGTRVELFRLMPQGPGAAYASITPTTLSIYPDLEQRAVARFAPLGAVSSAISIHVAVGGGVGTAISIHVAVWQRSGSRH